MNTLYNCILSIGLLIIIGAAGSCDINAISLMETILLVFAGLVLMLFGWLGCHIKNKKGGSHYD